MVEIILNPDGSALNVRQTVGNVPMNVLNSNDLRRLGATEAEINAERNLRSDISKVPLSVFQQPALPNPFDPSYQPPGLQVIRDPSKISSAPFYVDTLEAPPRDDNPIANPSTLRNISSTMGAFGLGGVPYMGPAGAILGMTAAGLQANREQNRLSNLGISPTLPSNVVSGPQAMVNTLGTTPWISWPSWLGGKPGEKRRINLFGSNNNIIPGLGIADSAKQQAQNILRDAYNDYDYRDLDMQDTRQSPAYTSVPTAPSIIDSMYGSEQPSNLDLMGAEGGAVDGSGVMAVSNQAAAQAAADRAYAGVDEMGFTANSAVDGDDGSSGDDGTVICTELHRQGKLCDEWFEVDKEVGQWFAKHDPDVMVGYHFWGKPLARVMKKSSFITYLVSLLALPWAKQMYIQQGNNEIGTLRGMFLYKLGLPICRTIGKVINSGTVHYVKSN